MDHWDFDIHEVEERCPETPLVFVGYGLFVKCNLLCTLGLDTPKLLSFLKAVDSE